MKTTISLVVVTLLFAAIPSHSGIIAGPITNPTNGHDYYLLTPNTWTAAEAEAEGMGGTLAIVRNDGEQKWIFSTFGNFGGPGRSLWIGLHRIEPGGKFVWVDGSHVDYAHWYPGQPDNRSGAELFVQVVLNGEWNDNTDTANPVNGVVEVPGKSNEKSLTEKEKELIGTWYASGNREHPCWIAGTENKLFQIYDGRATRLIFTVEGPLFLANGIRGEIVKDRILWSNGTWWSREPAEYLTPDKSETGKEPQPDTAQTR